jgi:hypothetical protein
LFEPPHYLVVELGLLLCESAPDEPQDPPGADRVEHEVRIARQQVAEETHELHSGQSLHVQVGAPEDEGEGICPPLRRRGGRREAEFPKMSAMRGLRQ